jgi:outer membrane cobalamin receptor
MTACRPSKLRLTTLALALAGATSSVWAQEAEVKELPTVQIRAPRIITPLPGVVIDEQQTTSNVQSMSGDEIRQSGSVSLTDAMNTQFQSINVNDYAGNPFQQDLNFRGFSASPLIGTPQGLSVYLDGVRINEAFGDVVNWDLIPNIAIQRMDLLPGSNPLFGHKHAGRCDFGQHEVRLHQSERRTFSTGRRIRAPSVSDCSGRQPRAAGRFLRAECVR